MSDDIRRRIVATAVSYMGKGREAISCPDLDYWCGAFVAHVLREAGLPVPDLDRRKQGEGVCGLLASTGRPLRGDVLRHPIGHYAIVIDGHTYSRHCPALNIAPLFAGNVPIIEGSNYENRVGMRIANGLNWTAYSISPLLDAYYYTGANTGEVG